MVSNVEVCFGVAGGWYPVSVSLFKTYKEFKTFPEVPCEGKIVYDVRGMDVDSIDLIKTTSWSPFLWVFATYESAKDYVILKLKSITGTVYFLDNALSELSHTNFTLTDSASTLSLSLPAGTAYVKVVITKVQFSIGYYANFTGPSGINIAKDSVLDTSYNMFDIVFKNASGVELDRVTLVGTKAISSAFDISTSYSIQSLAPEIEISYSLVNALPYNKYVGFVIDEIIGIVGPTDKLYVELYQDSELLASECLVGSKIRAGNYVLLEQSSENNSGANKIKIRLSASPQYKYTVKGRLVQIFKILGTV